MSSSDSLSSPLLSSPLKEDRLSSPRAPGCNQVETRTKNSKTCSSMPLNPNTNLRAVGNVSDYTMYNKRGGCPRRAVFLAGTGMLIGEFGGLAIKLNKSQCDRDAAHCDRDADFGQKPEALFDFAREAGFDGPGPLQFYKRNAETIGRGVLGDLNKYLNMFEVDKFNEDKNLQDKEVMVWIVRTKRAGHMPYNEVLGIVNIFVFDLNIM